MLILYSLSLCSYLVLVRGFGLCPAPLPGEASFVLRAALMRLCLVLGAPSRAPQLDPISMLGMHGHLDASFLLKQELGILESSSGQAVPSLFPH